MQSRGMERDPAGAQSPVPGGAMGREGGTARSLSFDPPVTREEAQSCGARRRLRPGPAATLQEQWQGTP